MQQYGLTFRGLTPLIMHSDNLTFSESVEEWRKDPANKSMSTKGDDRSPPWTWIGYSYHDGEYLGIPADNIMTMLREAGAKVPFKGKETFKKQTQSGIVVDQQQFELFSGGKKIPIEPIKALLGNTKFTDHIKAAEDMGFELFVKRATIGRAKHVRVRPLFRQWEARGSITVIDEELTGLTSDMVSTILRLAGAIVGLCDWRPSSPSKSGSYGKFEVDIEKM